MKLTQNCIVGIPYNLHMAKIVLNLIPGYYATTGICRGYFIGNLEKFITVCTIPYLLYLLGTERFNFG
jgi:hypothetical protein